MFQKVSSEFPGRFQVSFKGVSWKMSRVFQEFSEVFQDNFTDFEVVSNFCFKVLVFDILFQRDHKEF